MKVLFKLSVILLLATGCAKIPVSSVVLADALQAEGERMHSLNIAFVNQLFRAKRDAVEKFIHDEYAPDAINKFVVRVSKEMPATDFKKDFPELMQAIEPEINKRRDSLVTVLEMQKEKIVDKLNTDYKAFDNAFSDLKRLLESAAKVETEKQALYEKAKSLSSNRLDLAGIETALDKFIHGAGNVGGRVAEVSNAVNQYLTTK